MALGRRAGGFTILEVMMAIGVIAFGLLALLATFPNAMALFRSSRETQIAWSAARSKLDEMRALPFPDPAHPDAASLLDYSSPARATFTVQGLTSGAGKISFLSERQASTAFGGVNLDLDVNRRNNENVTATASWIAFPVQVEVSWQSGEDVAGRATQRGITLTTLIYNANH
jgi:Tfp pilus assembly protein PilV